MRAHVAGVHRHLVAEAAADVGRDHADLVLGQPGQSAYSVRWACGACVVHHSVSLPLTWSKSATAPHVSIGAGCERGKTQVLLDDDVGAREHVVGRGRVAGLPVEDVVVDLPVLVVADQRRVGVERGARVDDHRQLARTRRRSARARRAPSSDRRRSRTRPPGPGSGPCRSRARPGCRPTASASRRARAPPGRRR